MPQHAPRHAAPGGTEGGRRLPAAGAGRHAKQRGPIARRLPAMATAALVVASVAATATAWPQLASQRAEGAEKTVTLGAAATATAEPTAGPTAGADERRAEARSSRGGARSALVDPDPDVKAPKGAALRGSSSVRLSEESLRKVAEAEAERELARAAADGDYQAIAASLLPEFGFSQDQMQCLVPMWTRESNWTVSAQNPSSGAYGIPQALPGSKMASFGSDWQTNPATQIKWGLWYIKTRYGTPCGAWSLWQQKGWY